jgi:endo-beta-N-acetylglucosaminidase D
MTEAGNNDIFISNKTLYVNNSDAASYQFLNLAGVVVEKGLIVGNSFSKSMNLQAGTYIVKVGNKVSKVSLK